MISARHHKIIYLGFLHLMLILSIGCKTGYTPVAQSSDHIRVQASSDSAGYSITDKFLAPYRQKLKDSFSTVIATTTGDLVKRRPGGSLGNLVTKAIYEYCIGPKFHAPRPLFIVMNYGGIRLNEVQKGPITIGKIFELLPFENTLVSIEISGQELNSLIQDKSKEGGWPMFWNVRHIDTIIDLQHLYDKVVLVTNDYIAQGGDNCDILKTLPQKDTGILLRDIVIDYLRQQKTITPDETDYILK